MLKDYFLLTLLNCRQDYKLGTGIPVRAQRVNHRAKNKERQYSKGKVLEVVCRKPGYNVYYFSVGSNCSVYSRDLNLKQYFT